MSYDGSVLRAVAFELNEKILNGKIEKIYQISDFEIILNIRSFDKFKLYISVKSNETRINLTKKTYDNPKVPPAFCMLLRKHLEGFRITNIEQVEMDRILKISVNSKDEMGFEVKKSLYIELMGKHSNIILIKDETHQIIDAIKRVNFNMSSVREVLPGRIYDYKEIVNKINPLKSSLEENMKNFQGGKSVKNNLISTFMGFSPLTAREICYRANLDEDIPFNSLNLSQKEELIKSFNSIISEIERKNFSPTIVKIDDRVKDFSAIDLTIYPQNVKIFTDSISETVENYFEEKNLYENTSNKGSEVIKKVKTLIEREENKIRKQSDELNEALDREKYKIYGDLIASNLYKIKKGQREVLVENFYDDMKEIKIPLSEKLSPSENANKYYKKYSKLINAAQLLTNQLEKSKLNLEYLKITLYNLNNASTSDEIDDIKDELSQMGFISRKVKKKVSKKIEPLKFITSEGAIVYCGKNSKQNDLLTFKLMTNNDLWFHVKDAPGSHVILKEYKNFSDKSIEEAANIAAFYSSLRQGNNILVDYTTKINIKRHPAKILGLVNYYNFSSINIKTPKIIK